MQLHVRDRRAIADEFISKHVESLDKTGNPPMKNEIVALIPTKFYAYGNVQRYEILQQRSIHTFILSSNIANTRASINNIVKRKLQQGSCQRNVGKENNPNRKCRVNDQLIRYMYSTTIESYNNCTIRLNEIEDAVFVSYLKFKGSQIRNDKDINRVLINGDCKYSDNADIEIKVGVETDAHPNPRLQNDETFIINHLFMAQIPYDSPRC